MPGWGVYCATKAALDRYTQVLAAENSNVRSVSLAPGVVNTGMQKHIRASNPTDFPNLQRFVDMHDQGQLAEPAAVAAKILKFISSPDFGTTVLDDIRQHARSEEHTSELQSLMRISYAVFCLKKKKQTTSLHHDTS